MIGIDQQLAARVVALGILHYAPAYAMNDEYWQIPDTNTCFGMADKVVRDWRVAGAVLEKLSGETLNEFSRKVIVTTGRGSPYPNQWALAEKIRDPRAICEAGCEALEQT